MFPIRDHNPSLKTPYVTYILLAINVLVFLAYYPASDEFQVNRFYLEWGLQPGNVSDGRALHTIFTSMFLHAGWLHIAGNMLFLWIFGDNLEDTFGHFGFALFYLAAGIAAALIHVVSAPYSMVPLVGASGAIAGVMGGYLLLFPKAKIDILVIIIIFFKIFPIPAWIMLGIWFVIQLVNGVISDASMGGVAYWAHAGGFVAGLLFTFPIWQGLGARQFWARTEGHPDHPEAQYKFETSRIPKVQRKK